MNISTPGLYRDLMQALKLKIVEPAWQTANAQIAITL